MRETLGIQHIFLILSLPFNYALIACESESRALVLYPLFLVLFGGLLIAKQNKQTKIPNKNNPANTGTVNI